MMEFGDWMLYSRGTYWLFEHWREDGKNIYGKAKFKEKDQLLAGSGKCLSKEQIEDLENGKGVSIKQPDGTTFFFKYVNLD